MRRRWIQLGARSWSSKAKTPERASMEAFLQFERSRKKMKSPAVLPAMTMKDLTKITAPTEPTENECCGYDCANCVWIQYQDQVMAYEELLNAASPTAKAQPPVSEDYHVDFFSPEPDTATSHRNIPHQKGISSVAILKNEELCHDNPLKDKTTTTFQSTRNIQLDLKSSGLMYESADTLHLYLPNSKEIVHRCATRLQVSLSDHFRIKRQHESSAKLPTRLQRVEEDHLTVAEFLEWECDLHTRPGPSVLRTLARLATCEHEHDDLMTFISSSRESTSTSESLNLVQVLEKYPSIQLSFAMFLQLVSELVSRPYTISSSPRDEQQCVSLTVRVAQEGPALCSRYLASREPGDPIFISISPSDLHLPTSPTTPILMIGPGTGIAPFMAFLKDLARQSLHRPATLFFGCQHPEVDFLYAPILNHARDTGVLDRFEVAFSRTQASTADDAVSGEPIRYVQDLVIHHREYVYNLMVHQKGVVYVCGSLKMGMQVKRVMLRRILMEYGGWTKPEARKFLDQMTLEGRYLSELYRRNSIETHAEI